MRKQFPAQTGDYAVKIKSEQSTDNWQNFDVARLQISVGQDYHEGDKLRAVAEWAKGRFEKVVVCVNDTLQRFDLMFETGLDEEAAKSTCLVRGEEWLERNTGLFTDGNVEFVRWESWLNDPGFEPVYRQIEMLYASNEEFKHAIDGNVAAIWERRRASNAVTYSFNRFKDFVDLSRRYLLEEIAVFAMMFERERAIDVYPGTVIFAATVFQGRDVEGAPSGLGKGHFCRIDFSHRKTLVPPMAA